MSNKKDFATSTVLTAPSPADSGTSLVVQSGHGARFPSAPFYVTVHPPSEFPTLDNAEKILVTAKSTDTFTIDRAEGDTVAQDIEAGWHVSNAVFLDDFPDTFDDLTDGTTNKAYTDAEKTKLSGIETAADVTDAGNVGSSIHGATGKTTPVDADTVPLIDSEASNVLKKLTWANLKAAIKSYYDSVTATMTNKTLTSPVINTGVSGTAIDTDGTLAANSDTKLASQKATKTYVSDLMPIGSVIPYAGVNVPSGNWLFAYGQAVSRTTYADLFAALSTTYGSGDGSTTFNLPDMRGRVAAGQDDMGGTSANRLTNPGSTGGMDGDVLGNTGGQEAHVQTIGELATHSHTVNRTSSSGATTNYGVPPTNNTWTSNDTGAVNSTGSSTAFNVVQPTIILNYIIKAL